MKQLKLVLISLCLISFCGCKKTEEAPAATETPAAETAAAETAEASAETTEKFQYVHDPRENPEAMKDIIEDPNAVYGFAPNPESERLGAYAEYDWSDEAIVAEAKKRRQEYHASMDSMTDIIYKMRDEGATTEEIARAVSAERNRLRLETYKDDPEALEKTKQSNLETYGHEEGPTADQLYEKYGSWAMVVQKAFAPNLGMDVICGLYDDNYQLYIELGLAEDK